MKQTKWPSLFMIVLFCLTSAATIYFMYEYLTWMLDDTNKKMFQGVLVDAIRRSFKITFELTNAKYFMWVAIGALLMIMKWAGSFILFRKKPWGYALYLFPNLLLLGTMSLIMFLIIPMDSWTMNIVGIWAGTLLFIVCYTVALISLTGRKKRLRAEAVSAPQQG